MAITLFAIGFWFIVWLVWRYLDSHADAANIVFPLTFIIVSAIVIMVGDAVVLGWYSGSPYLWGHEVMWYDRVIWTVPQLLIFLMFLDEAYKDKLREP